MTITALADVERRERHIAIGVFDGVHLGHRAVIEGTDTVLTFDPHPSEIIRPGSHPALLTTQRHRAELLSALGVDAVLVLPFTLELSRWTPEEFVKTMLVDTLHDATTIPTSAVQRGAPGTFVYLIKPDDTVTVRPVKLGPAAGERIAVESGLAPGDKVVVDGADKLKEGAKIAVAGAAKPAGANPAGANPAGGANGGGRHKRGAATTTPAQ